MVFENDLKRADKYEKLVLKRIYFNNLNEFETAKWELKDVRSLPEYQSKDVDFLINPVGFKIELKVDFTNMPNFFFEIISSDTYNTIGAIYKTQSDEVWYYYEKTDELYRFNVITLKDYLIKKEFEIKEINEKYQARTNKVLKPREVLTIEEFRLMNCRKSGGDNAIGICLPIEMVTRDLNPLKDYLLSHTH